MNEKQKNRQITGNTGLFYACYHLSCLGWNVIPTSRNAKGIDIVIYDEDAKKYLGIQVKSLSKRNPVPIGNSLEKIIGDFWIIINKVREQEPGVFILRPKEVIDRVSSGSNKDGKNFYWLEPKQYEQEKFRNAWERLEKK